jgi:hypothetical protein
MASDIFISSFAKPISILFFCIRENLLHETHDEAQDPKGQERTPHSHNDHCDSKGPIIHVEIPPVN